MNRQTLVVGATGGIGKALVAALIERGDKVIAVSRGRDIDDTWPEAVTSYRLKSHTDENIATLINHLHQNKVKISLAVVTTGILHDEDYPVSPEKRLEDIDENALLRYFAVNSIIPGLWLKHLIRVMGKGQPTLVCLSARVGSISDNKLGGWYGYRASKAALNMLLKTASVEYARRLRQPLLVSYHPGTVDTALSHPFQRNVKPDKLFTPTFTARQLLQHIATLDRQQPCHYIDWEGKVVTW